MFIRIEELSDQVILFRPVYSPQGNITEILLRNNPSDPCYDLRSIHPVRFALARAYAVDLPVQAKIIKKTFHRSAIVPFYLPDGRVFVPLKMRSHCLEADSSYGYVEIQAVSGLTENDQTASLRLVTGQTVPLFTSIITVRAMLYLGHEIHRTYFNKDGPEDAVVLDAVRILLKRMDKLEKHLEDL